MNSFTRFVLTSLATAALATVGFAAAPANDNLASAIDLGNAATATASGNSVGATIQTSEVEYSDGSASHETVWWKWKAPSAGTTTITTYGIGFDSEMKVFSGPASSPTITGLTAVTLTGTTVGNAGTGYRCSFTAVSGTSYYIQVDGNVNGTTQTADFNGNVHAGTVRFVLFQGTYKMPTVTIPALNPQPSSGVATGQTMTFNSGASAAGGQSLVFQWYQMDKDGNSVLLTDGTVSTGVFTGETVSGSTTATLLLSNMPSPGTPGIVFGNVILVVANTDGSGSAISNSEGITDFFSAANIDTQPVGATTSTTTNITAGTNATFTIVADGGPLPTFQWKKGGVNLANGLQTSGSTVSVANSFNSTTNFNTSVLTITSTSSGDNGSYTCVVANTTTTSNSTTSSAVTLTVTGTAKSSQSAPVISSTTTTTFGASYTATANTGFGALSWALGTGSTAAGAAINSSSGIISYTSVGTVVIHATFAGDTTHNPATSADFTITVGKANQSAPVISSGTSTTFGATYTATANTGTGALTWALGTGSTAAGAAINSSSGVISYTGVGTVVIHATFAGDATHNSATSADFTVTVNKASQSAPAISSAATMTFGASYTATVSNSGFGALSWALGSGSTASVIAINSGTGAVTSTGVGTIVINATFAGDATHNPATSADFTITVSKANQAAPVISSAATTTFGTSYTATANSGTGALSWALGTGSTATGAAINSTTGAVSYTSVGTVVITAAFAGDANHNSATSANFTVTVNKVAATFALNNSSFTYTGAAQGPTVVATPSNATFSPGGTLSATAAGSYSGSATATGNYSGSNVSLTWSIAKANQAAPVISSAATATVGVAYTATANTGSGALNWALGTGSTAAGAAINGTSGAVSFTAAGTVVITATFAGDANHNGATSANFTITVSAATTAKPSPMDFDGDGKTDLVWSNLTTGDRALWYMNGITIKSFGYIAGIPTEWRIVGTGDIDGDGHNDLIWENISTGDRTFWQMNNTAILNFGYLGLVDTAWHIAATGDFSGDGKMDIIWENRTTGDRAIWYLNNGAVSSFGYIAGIDPAWHIVAAADFDGDGKTDLLWENATTGDRSLWLMDGINILNFVYVAGVDPHWHIVAAVDVNGDGHPDLIWENTSTGDRTVWYMNGANLTGMDYIAFVDPTWEIAP